MTACFRRSGRQRGAVGGEDRRSRRQIDLALQVLIAFHAGKGEAFLPGDPSFGEGKLDRLLHLAEGHGVDGDRHRHGRRPVGHAFVLERLDGSGIAGCVCLQQAGGRYLRGFAVGDDEVVEPDLAL